MMECACGISGSLNQECRKRFIQQMFRVPLKRIFADESFEGLGTIMRPVTRYP